MIPKRLQLIALLLAGFLTTGAQWDVVQVVAWARMFVQASVSGESLRAALADTFSGELCEICAVVDEARQSEPVPATPAPAGSKAAKAVLVAHHPAGGALVFSPVSSDPAASQWSLSDQVGSSAERGAPPAPPPKA